MQFQWLLLGPSYYNSPFSIDQRTSVGILTVISYVCTLCMFEVERNNHRMGLRLHWRWTGSILHLLSDLHKSFLHQFSETAYIQEILIPTRFCIFLPHEVVWRKTLSINLWPHCKVSPQEDSSFPSIKMLYAYEVTSFLKWVKRLWICTIIIQVRFLHPRSEFYVLLMYDNIHPVSLVISFIS